MRRDRAAGYADALGCSLGADREDPERVAVIVGRRWCWTECELFSALDARARGITDWAERPPSPPEPR